MNKVLANSLQVIVTAIIALLISEGLIRFKNASMSNYNIEMWRYARELKFASPDPSLGHEHLPNSSARLQSVDFRINEFGLRGGPVTKERSPETRRILMLGASTAFGWGVDEDKTVSGRLQSKFDELGQNVEVLNGGIGNYNLQRSINRFFKRLAILNPTDILIYGAVRDAEELEQGGGSFLLRHSQLAVTLWIAVNKIFGPKGESTLIDHYRKVYDPDAPNMKVLKQEFTKLAEYARENNIRVTLAVAPNTQLLTDYPFEYIHKIYEEQARVNGFEFIDLLPAFDGLTSEEVWVMPSDPHANALGHSRMADAIFPVLEAQGVANQ